MRMLISPVSLTLARSHPIEPVWMLRTSEQDTPARTMLRRLQFHGCVALRTNVNSSYLLLFFLSRFGRRGRGRLRPQCPASAKECGSLIVTPPAEEPALGKSFGKNVQRPQSHKLNSRSFHSDGFVAAISGSGPECDFAVRFFYQSSIRDRATCQISSQVLQDMFRRTLLAGRPFNVNHPIPVR